MVVAATGPLTTGRRQMESRGARRVLKISGPVLLGLGSAVAGVSGLVVTWAVATSSGAEQYAVFGVFWSALYLIIGCLFGVQQEVTRVVVSDAPSDASTSAWRFASLISVVVGVSVVATVPLWGPASLGDEYWPLGLAIAVGAAAYAFVVTVTGVLTGTKVWHGVAFIAATDGIVRLVAIVLTLSFTQDPAWLAWAVVLPFPVTLGLAWLFYRRNLRGRMVLSDTYGSLFWNICRTVIAAAGASVLINGFPAVIAFFARDVSASELGALILALTLTRAPILMPLTALQSFLIVALSNRSGRQFWRVFGIAFAGLIAVGVVGSVIVFFFGTVLLELIFGPDFAVAGVVLVGLVIGGMSVGGMYVTGPAVLARGGHTVYASGWIVAVIASVGVLLVAPFDLAGTVVFALVLGPVLGILTHVGYLVVRDRDFSA